MVKINKGIKGGIHLDGKLENIRSYYDKWVETYDDDMIDGEYVGSKIIVDFLLDIPPNQYIQIDPLNKMIELFDAGCGTGLVGVTLSEKGYKNISGCDLNEAMVEQAKQKNIYQDLYSNVDLNQPIPVAWQKKYDIVLSSGVFTCGHVLPSTLFRLFDIARVGGLAIVSTRKTYYDEYHFKKVIKQATEEKKAIVVHKLENAAYTSDENAHYWAFAIVA